MTEIHAPMPLIVDGVSDKVRNVMRTVGVPWEIIAPHEKQAQINHDQTLERLRQRGGLSPGEAVAILEDRHWRDTVDLDEATAITRLAEIVREHTARRAGVQS